MPTNGDTQIVWPAPVVYGSLAFSPDGNYIYFRKAGNAAGSYFELYRATVLGGTPQTIVRDIDSDITFSPDAQRIAFLRQNNPEAGKYRLISTNLDGGDEKILGGGPVSDAPLYLAWSPDGKTIAYSRFQPDSVLGGVDVLDVASGKTRDFARFGDKRIAELRWLPDGHAILVVYQDTFTRVQIGAISYPGGQLRPITRDINRYGTLTLSSDGMTLATVQFKGKQTLLLVPAGSQTKADTLALPQSQLLNGFNWASDGKLLVSDSSSLVRMDADGNNRTTLISEAGVGEASTCGTRYLLFPWMLRHGSEAVQIWRTDANGANPVKLTNGKRDFSPACSADLKWVYYTNGDANQNWRVPLDGGKSELVPGTIVPNSIGSGAFSISPDGKVAAFETTISTNVLPAVVVEKVALLNLDSEGATTPRLLDVDQRISGLAKFTTDGKAVAYLITDKGVDNIWMQPLDGSAGRQVTSFKSDRIGEFYWSPDGKVLGVLQYHADSDVVLIRDKSSLPQ